MRRREFITIFAGAATTWAFAASAQQPAKTPRIGVLWHAGSAEQEGTNYRALVKGFADIGYIDGNAWPHNTAVVAFACRRGDRIDPNVRLWHKADIPTRSTDVRFWE